MARSLNKVQLIGNVGNAPEIKTVGANRVASFSIATTEQWKSKDGEKQERTDWHRCTVWGPLVDVVEKYVNKGSKLYVEGSLKIESKGEGEAKRTYVDVNIRDLILLDNKGEGAGSAAPTTRPAAASARPAARPTAAAKAPTNLDSEDDDLPF